MLASNKKIWKLIHVPANLSLRAGVCMSCVYLRVQVSAQCIQCVYQQSLTLSQVKNEFQTTPVELIHLGKPHAHEIIKKSSLDHPHACSRVHCITE